MSCASETRQSIARKRFDGPVSFALAIAGMARAQERCGGRGIFRDRSVKTRARRAPMRLRHLLVLGIVIIQTACSGTSNDGTGGDAGAATGGATVNGGAPATGGATVNGGAPATGGYRGLGGQGINPAGGFMSSGGNTGAIACGKNFCSAGQYCCNPSCGICGPAGGLCPNIACGTGGASSANLTAGEACTQGSCAAGLLCCYPCGTAGCTNQCMQPASNGQCPMYP